MPSPITRPAKALLAETYDQLAYQAESGPWRDVYLSGAYELRHGAPGAGVRVASAAGLLRQTPVQYFFDTMAVMLNGPEADGTEITINVTFTDLGKPTFCRSRTRCCTIARDRRIANANASKSLTHDLFVRMLTGQAGIKDLLLSDELEIEGSKLSLAEFFSLFDKPEGKFAIVTP